MLPSLPRRRGGRCPGGLNEDGAPIDPRSTTAAILSGPGKMQLALSILISALLPAAQGFAASSDLTTNRLKSGLEVPVTPEIPNRAVGNNSPSLAVDPTDARFAVVAGRIDGPDYGCTLHLSGNRGRGWTPALPVPSLPSGVDKCYAPSVAFDSKGLLYYVFTGLAGRGNVPAGTFFTASSDRGRTFSRPRRLLGPRSYMVRVVVDTSRDRLHVVWVQPTRPPLATGFSAPTRIMAKFSDDGGKNFTPPVQVSDPRRPRVIRPALAAGRDGTIHVIYYDLGDDVRDFMGLEGPTWEGKWNLVSAVSTNYGRSFGRHSAVDEDVLPPERIMLVFNSPPPALVVDGKGRTYAAWSDARNGDWDVLVRSSRNLGRTWGNAVRANDDPAGTGKHQYLPGLGLSRDGRLDIAFYDRRQDPENLRNHVNYTYSRNGGRSFSSNRTLSSEPSDSRVGFTYPSIPSSRGLNELGSQPSIVASPATVLVTWTDSRWADEPYEQQIVASRITFPAR